jgi:hypothetical protein
MSNNKSRQLSRKAGGPSIFQIGGRNPGGLLFEKEIFPNPGIPNDLIRIVFRAVIGTFKESRDSNLPISAQVDVILHRIFNRVENDISFLKKYGSDIEIDHLIQWIQDQKTAPKSRRFFSPLSDLQRLDIEKRLFLI